MKKLIYILCCMFYFSIFSSLSCQTRLEDVEDCFQTCYRAIDNHINIRTESNKNCKILGQLNIDDEIYVNLEKNLDKWLYCYVPKFQSIAYCSSEYFVLKPEISGEIKEKYFNGEEEIIKEYNANHIQGVYLDKLIEYDLNNFTESKCLDIVKRIYESHNFKISDSTVLISAAKLNYYEVVKYLVEKEDIRSEINTKNNEYAPSLFWALYNGNYNVAKLLLNNGADPNFYTVSSMKAFDCLSEFVNDGVISEENSLKLKKLLSDYGYN